MPTYDFENTKTGKIFTEFMTMDEREDYLKANPHIKQLINSINIVSGIGSNRTMGKDSGWKETLSKIAEKHPNSALAKEHSKKTIKQTQTENVIAKHRARRK
jgi:predicted nucleic acid-binding Zn ribbon protein